MILAPSSIYRKFSKKELQEMDLEALEAEMANRIYHAALFFEELEFADRIVGNGHHAAQKIAKFACDELTERFRR